MRIAIWMMAVSLVVLALCAVGYVWLRISDELRFRRAITDIEDKNREGGAIVLSKRTRTGPAGRTGDYRREKAQKWIDERARE